MLHYAAHGGRSAAATRARRLRRAAKLIACPPLALLEPTPKGAALGADEHPASPASWGHQPDILEAGKVHSGPFGHRAAHGHGHGHGGGEVAEASFGVMLPFSLLCLAFLRFATEPDLSGVVTHGERDLMVATLPLPGGSGLLVAAFWLAVLWGLVKIGRLSQPPGMPRRPLRHILVPETAALLLFFFADLSLEAFCIADADKSLHLSLDEVWDARVELAHMVRRRWFMANFALLLAITTMEGLNPPPGTKRAMLFDAGWLLIIIQAVSLFLHQTISRHDFLQEYDCTYAAVLYGLTLYFFTHSIALMVALVFRKHVGVEHPPSLYEVLKLLLRHPSRNFSLVAGFSAAFLALALLPARADWRAASAGHAVAEAAQQLGCHGSPPHVAAPWLLPLALSQSAGARSLTVVNAVNALAILAALRCWHRAGKRPRCEHASWEATLVMATGCLASLVWWALLCPERGHEASGWQTWSRLLGATAHFVLAHFTADTFAHHLKLQWHECTAVTAWAAFQVLQGLATEHHATVCHGAGHGLTVRHLLVHLGEFGMCEFGLIATVGWLTYITEHADVFLEDMDHDLLQYKPAEGKPSLRRRHTIEG